MLLEPTIVFSFFTEIAHVVHYDIMHLSAIKRILGGTISELKCIIRCFVAALTIIHVMITEALEEWNAHFGDGLVVVVEELQLIPYNVSNSNSMNQCTC